MPKTEIKLKKSKRARKFIKDKAIVDFLLEHMKPVKIDFSKIRFPSFSYFQEKEEKNWKKKEEKKKEKEEKNQKKKEKRMKRKEEKNQKKKERMKEQKEEKKKKKKRRIRKKKKRG